LLVTNTTSLLPFQIISRSSFMKMEISDYGHNVWTLFTIPYTEVYIGGFYFISYNGAALSAALGCGAYDFKLTAGETWYFEPITVKDFTITENAYTIRDDLMLPFKFSEQQYETTPLIAPCDSFLPFMFSTENTTLSPTTPPTIYLYDVDANCVVTELTDIVVTVLTISGKTYYIHDGECFYPFLECGTYKLEIVDGTHSYFSVPFSAVCDMNDIPDGYRVMLDFNRCVMRDEDGEILIEECSDIPFILLNRYGTPTKVYVYEVALKTIGLLSINNITTNSSDIAHTENKLWLYAHTGAPLYSIILKEWNISISPFSETYNRTITGFKYSAGLCAKDDNTLIGIESIFGGGSYTTKVYECDITTNVSSNTYKFDLLPNRSINGDYILTSTNKLIVTTNSSPDTTIIHITQYDYLTGVMEVDIQISPSVHWAFGLFEYNNEIYIVDEVNTTFTYVWKIDKDPPYSLTLYDSINFGMLGASQIPSQLDVHFST
jgi:hypothetical protein